MSPQFIHNFIDRYSHSDRRHCIGSMRAAAMPRVTGSSGWTAAIISARIPKNARSPRRECRNRGPQPGQCQAFSRDTVESASGFLSFFATPGNPVNFMLQSQ
jgi:hypothetical protein